MAFQAQCIVQRSVNRPWFTHMSAASPGAVQAHGCIVDWWQATAGHSGQGCMTRSAWLHGCMAASSPAPSCARSCAKATLGCAPACFLLRPCGLAAVCSPACKHLRTRHANLQGKRSSLHHKPATSGSTKAPVQTAHAQVTRQVVCIAHATRCDQQGARNGGAHVNAPREIFHFLSF